VGKEETRPDPKVPMVLRTQATPVAGLLCCAAEMSEAGACQDLYPERRREGGSASYAPRNRGDRGGG
jgi:hypothetical protein